MTALREATGFGLVVAGLLGLLLPFLPGVPLLLAGVAVLGANHPRIQPGSRGLNGGAVYCEGKQREMPHN